MSDLSQLSGSVPNARSLPDHQRVSKSADNSPRKFTLLELVKRRESFSQHNDYTPTVRAIREEPIKTSLNSDEAKPEAEPSAAEVNDNGQSETKYDPTDAEFSLGFTSKPDLTTIAETDHPPVLPDICAFLSRHHERKAEAGLEYPDLPVSPVESAGDTARWVATHQHVLSVEDIQPSLMVQESSNSASKQYSSIMDNSSTLLPEEAGKSGSPPYLQSIPVIIPQPKSKRKSLWSKLGQSPARSSLAVEPGMKPPAHRDMPPKRASIAVIGNSVSPLSRPSSGSKTAAKPQFGTAMGLYKTMAESRAAKSSQNTCLHKAYMDQLDRMKLTEVQNLRS